MLLRPFLNDETSCASYLFGCGTHATLAVVDPHEDLVDGYLAAADALGAPILRACSQAGLVNNLNHVLVWGLAPLYLAAHGASVGAIAVVAAAYPVVWGAGQVVTGWLSDHTGRKPLIASGMLVQAGALGLLVAGNGAFAPSLTAALLLGAGTAMVYPTLLAAVSDASKPHDRARVIGVYRFWRDFGFVLGALIAGAVADAASSTTAIAIVAALTALSGVLVSVTSWQVQPSIQAASAA
jgi:MFS family permease